MSAGPHHFTFAKRLTEHAGGAKIYFKREDLNHTGAHKINNTIGQCLLTKRMGKPRIIAETGAGQHGVASATAAALLGLQCDVYMGAEDVRRQKLNVFKMRALGAKVISVETGSRTLRDAINEAMRDWMASVENDSLRHRQRDGTTSVSDHGSGFSISDRRRNHHAISAAIRSIAMWFVRVSVAAATQRAFSHLLFPIQK